MSPPIRAARAGEISFIALGGNALSKGFGAMSGTGFEKTLGAALGIVSSFGAAPILNAAFGGANLGKLGRTTPIAPPKPGLKDGGILGKLKTGLGC
jgi:hypothetical protein